MGPIGGMHRGDKKGVRSARAGLVWALDTYAERNNACGLLECGGREHTMSPLRIPLDESTSLRLAYG